MSAHEMISILEVHDTNYTAGRCVLARMNITSSGKGRCLDGVDGAPEGEKRRMGICALSK